MTAVLLGSLAFASAPAAAKSAEGIHSYLYSVNAEEVGAGYFWDVTGVGVDNYPASPVYGDVYVGANGFDKVSRFTPGSTSASLDCNITGAGENSEDPTECAKEGPAVPVGQFRGMFGVAVDPSNGNVYADDNGFFYNETTEEYETPHEINMFNSAGVLQKSVNLGESHANRIAAAAGVLYLANETHNAIEKWVPETGALTTFSTGSDAPTGRFGNISGVTVDTDPSSPSYNDVYAVDQGANEIQSYPAPAPESEYTLTFKGQTTERLPGTASTQKIKEKLEKLSTIHTAGEATENVQVYKEGSEYQVEFTENLGTTNVPQLEGEVIAAGPIAVSTVTNGVIPALDKLNAAGEYECQITGAGAETTSTSECSTAKPGIVGGHGFNTRGGLAGAAAVDPSNGHIYVENRVVYEPIPFSTYNHLFIDEFNANGEYIAAIEESTEYQLDAFNIAVSARSHDLFFTNLNQFKLDVFGGDKPLIKTQTATQVGSGSAVFQGTVNPLDFPIEECKFEYAEAAKWKPKAAEPYAEGNSVPCEGTLGSDEAVHSVEAHVSGLQAGKIYYFRIVAKNANGTSVGEDEVLGAPYAGTYVATEIGQTTAKLNGVVNPDNGEATYHFEYGPTTSYGTSIPINPAGPLTGKQEQEVGETIGGLQEGTTYHYRLVATDASGTTYGHDHNFTTAPAAMIDGIAAAHQTKDSAVLQAYVDPLGSSTTYHFEWGPTTAYGHSTPAESAGSGNETSLQKALITGLQPGTEYHFRAVASNANGTVTGPDRVLITEADCPNEARRQEQGNPGTMLPDCRAFERVSPEEKGDAPVASPELGTTGEYVLYKSLGVFAGAEWPATPILGAEYLAHRTSQGWVTESIHPTTKQVPLRDAGLLQATTPDLSETIWGGSGNNLNEAEEPTGSTFYRRSRDGAFAKDSPTLESIGVPWEEAGVSGTLSGNANLTHMVFTSVAPLLPSDPYPSHFYRLYDLTLGPNGSLALVSVANGGGAIPTCGGGDGSLKFGSTAFNSATNAVTPDGSHIFFEVVPQGECHPEGFGRINYQLYARIDRSQTVPISEPETNEDCLTSRCRTSPPQESNFSGASADGSKVFFTNTHPLVDEGTEDTVETDMSQICDDYVGLIVGPNGCNLYMYDFNRPAGHNLVDISGGVPPGTAEEAGRAGLGPQVKYVLRSSSDGSHVYFVARGLLTDTPNSLGQRARQGAENFYDYDTETEQMKFIARFCDGFEKSGTIADPKCSGNDHQRAWEQFPSSNGLILAFTTYSEITPDDKNQSTDVYRYDAATGSIERISIGHNGEDDENGNAGGGAVLMPGGSCQSTEKTADCQPANAVRERPMTDDGSMIVFGTSRPLENGDNNEQEDAYEWHDGQVSLISGGKSHIPISAGTGFSGGSNPVISADGRDITFATDTGLIESDKDGLADAYDARIDGGFPPQASGSNTCHGSESCAGQLQTPPAAPTFGSETFTAPRQEHHCHKGFVQKHHQCVRRKRSHPRRHRKHRHRGRAHGKRGGRR